MAINYNYEVRIQFKEKNPLLTEKFQLMVDYKKSKGNQDRFIFAPSSIVLKLKRSRKYKSILSNPQNSINTQIIKSIIAYYSVSSIYSQIKSIQINYIEGKNKTPLLESATFQQPLQISIPIQNNSYFKKEVIQEITTESEKGECIRIALSYWLKAQIADDLYVGFENLWRAFNRLYVYYGKQSNENTNLCEIRKFIIANAHHFPQTIKITNSYLEQELLHSFRWQKLILNDYPTQKHTQALIDFIHRYTDKRIMKLLQEKLVCREDNIKSLGKWDDIQNYLNSNKNTSSDIELVTLLCIKYAYFLRNKFFHGEILNGTFKLTKDYIDLEFEKLNKLLSMLIFELVNNNILP